MFWTKSIMCTLLYQINRWFCSKYQVLSSRISVSGVRVHYSPAARISKSTAKHKLPPLSDNEYVTGCKLGLDSHADVHCVGRHARITEVFEGRSCTVHPFNDSYAPMSNVNTVNACFAYDTDEGETYILHVNQALD